MYGVNGLMYGVNGLMYGVLLNSVLGGDQKITVSIENIRNGSLHKYFCVTPVFFMPVFP